MKQRFKVLFITFSLLFLLQQTSIFALAAENIELLTCEKYYERVHSLFGSATESVFVTMYSFRYYYEYPNSPSNILLQDLIRAKEKGVDVTVLLDISGWNEENTKENRRNPFKKRDKSSL